MEHINPEIARVVKLVHASRFLIAPETSRIATINDRACRAKFCAGVRRDLGTGAGVANPR
jgi:hypothetical protein